MQPRAHHADVALLPLLVPDLELRLLEDVHQSSGQLGVEIQVEKMRLGLFLLHDLSKGIILIMTMKITLFSSKILINMIT